MTIKRAACLAVAFAAAISTTNARQKAAAFTSGSGAMAVVSVAVHDACVPEAARRVSAAAVWIDGRYDHELLLFPASERERYDTLVGPLPAGRHEVELRSSAFWQPAACLRAGSPEVRVVEASQPANVVLEHAPVLELRADTVGEQSDVPLFEYVEDLPQDGARKLRYTVVFSNEDGGTQTRALYARWGRATDIEQVYEALLRNGRVVLEEFQGPDHEIRAFDGRRRGKAPILLVATLNNMVTDRGRGVAAVRPVPDLVNLSEATRESTLDARPWAYRVMHAEMAAEGRIAAAAPADDRWLRVAPDAREHLYVEARLTLDHAAVAAWAKDRSGRRVWSHYERDSLAIARNGWVRTAIAIGPGGDEKVAEIGWACLRAPDDPAPGRCTIEATRTFVLGEDWMPGPNLLERTRLSLRVGEEARVALVPSTNR